jgi:hypothetical protein
MLGSAGILGPAAAGGCDGDGGGLEGAAVPAMRRDPSRPSDNISPESWTFLCSERWTGRSSDPYRTDVSEDPALPEPDPWFGDEPVTSTLSGTCDRLGPGYAGPRYPQAVRQLREMVAFNVIEQARAPHAALGAAHQEVEAIG